MNRLNILKTHRCLDTACEEARKCLIDYLGVTVAGYPLQKDGIDSLLKLHGDGNAPAVGTGKTTSMLGAAAVNGMNAHVAELDDGHREGMIHLGAPIISALIAACRDVDMTGKGLLQGIVAGYEAAVTCAADMQPSHRNRGYHTTGTCGTIGAAVAVCTAAGCSDEVIRNAVSASVAGAAGVLEIQEDSSRMKPYNAGHAAMSGLAAATVAMAGFNGPDDIISGGRGLYGVMADEIREYDEAEALEDFEKNGVPAICRIYEKFYASCRHGHSAIQAAVELHDADGLVADDIKSIDIYTYRTAIKGHDHTEIHGQNSAKMSIPFAVASAAAKGHADIADFTDECLADTKLMSITEATAMHEDPEMTNSFPAKRMARVQITGNDGVVHVAEMGFAKGDYENPLTAEEVKAKYRSLTEYAGADAGYSERLLKLAENIEEDFEEFKRFIK